MRQNGAADSRLLLRNDPLAAALFLRAPAVRNGHQRKENTHENLVVPGWIGILS